MVLAVLAFFTEHPWSGALWMLLPAVILHVYPVFMQRSILLRLQPLLDAQARLQTDPPRSRLASVSFWPRLAIRCSWTRYYGRAECNPARAPHR